MEKKEPSRRDIADFVIAAIKGDERAVRKFCKNYPDHVDAPDNIGQTALGAVARNHHTAIGELLLDAKADPNKPALFGESPFLTCVAFSFHYPDDYRLLDRMLKTGANVNFQQQAWAKGGFKQPETLTTALMETASLQDEKLCDYLLKNGANPLLKDAEGKTARDHVQDFLNGPIGNAPDKFTDRLIAKLEQAEKEWASRPTSEWRGKVDPNIHSWQGH
ncbi:MAG: ankyrin repeat domain-containing protein [Alphaproteobacteria bacterium]|nr:ankyrin repeat domain-containing protein [Alphaproteobacteria bacterium]